MYDHTYSVDILTNERRTVLYLGVTSDLRRRLWWHKNGKNNSFARRYNLTVLLYFEHFHEVTNAISRDTELKKWSRAKKLALVRSKNPSFSDLSPQARS